MTGHNFDSVLAMGAPVGLRHPSRVLVVMAERKLAPMPVTINSEVRLLVVAVRLYVKLVREQCKATLDCGDMLSINEDAEVWHAEAYGLLDEATFLAGMIVQQVDLKANSKEVTLRNERRVTVLIVDRN